MGYDVYEISEILANDITKFSQFTDLKKLKHKFTAYPQHLMRKGVISKNITEFKENSSGFFINEGDADFIKKLNLPFFTEMYAEEGVIKFLRTYFIDESTQTISGIEDLFLNKYHNTNIVYDARQEFADGNPMYPLLSLRDGPFYSGFEIIDTKDVLNNDDLIRTDFVEKFKRYVYDLLVSVSYITQQSLFFLSEKHALQFAHDNKENTHIMIGDPKNFYENNFNNNRLELELSLPFNKTSNILVLLENTQISNKELLKTLSDWYGDEKSYLRLKNEGEFNTSFQEGLKALNLPF